MRAIERENDELKGVLPKIFGKADFSPQMLGGLMDHFTNLNLTGMADDFDSLGRVYEFFLGEFFAMQGKAGSEQYKPRCMVTLMVEMIESYWGSHFPWLHRKELNCQRFEHSAPLRYGINRYICRKPTTSHVTTKAFPPLVAGRGWA